MSDSVNARLPLSIALMLESDGPGGAEVVVFQLGVELARRGHRVVPIGPAAGIGWLGQKFRDAGFKPEVFYKRHPLDPRWFSDLAITLHSRQVDIVHSHEFAMGVYGTGAARRIGVPHVITMHGSQSMAEALRRRVALRWAFRNSYATAAVSAATKRQLDVDLGVPADQIRVIRNGIPVRIGNRAVVRRELGVREDELLILSIGNLDERKGHLVLLKALHQLLRAGLSQPWRLVIAGGRGGSERSKLEAFVAEHSMIEHLHILTYREDVPDLQAAADIFAMPSLWEGLPLAVLEAMLAGKAIVASDTSGIPEAITNEEHGLLTPPGEVDSLAKALGRLLTDPSLRQRLGEAASARGMRDFTIGAMADAYEHLYRRTK